MAYTKVNLGLKVWRATPLQITHAAWSDDEMNGLHDTCTSVDVRTVPNGDTEVIEYDLTAVEGLLTNVSRVAVYCTVQNIADWTVETSQDMVDWTNEGALTDGGAYVYINVGRGVRGVRVTIVASVETVLQEVIIYSDPTYSGHKPQIIFTAGSNSCGDMGTDDSLQGLNESTGEDAAYKDNLDLGAGTSWAVDTEHPAASSGFLLGVAGFYGILAGVKISRLAIVKPETNHWYVRDVRTITASGDYHHQYPIIIDPPLVVEAGDLLAIKFIGDNAIYCEDDAGSSFWWKEGGTVVAGDIFLKADFAEKADKLLRWWVYDHPPTQWWSWTPGEDWKSYWPYMPIPDRWCNSADGVATDVAFMNYNVPAISKPKLAFWPMLSTIKTAATALDDTLEVHDCGLFPSSNGKIRIIDATEGNEDVEYESHAAGVITLKTALTLDHAKWCYILDISKFFEFSKDGVTWYLPEAEEEIEFDVVLGSQDIQEFYLRKTDALEFGHAIDQDIYSRLYVYWAVTAEQ